MLVSCQELEAVHYDLVLYDCAGQGRPQRACTDAVVLLDWRSSLRWKNDQNLVGVFDGSHRAELYQVSRGSTRSVVQRGYAHVRKGLALTHGHEQV